MKDKDTNHGEQFSFNANVTSCFSDMLSRSIPQYDVMRGLTTDIIAKYMHMKDNSYVLDIGSSTGESISTLCSMFPNTTFIGLENSDPMLKEAKSRFIDNHNVVFKKHDIRNEFLCGNKMNAIISCLTIQFTPIEYRLQIMKNMFDLLHDDGVFILVEKVIGASAEIDKKLVELYYDMKKSHGYSTQEIKRKKMALEGVLVPVTAKWNEELLKTSGFKEVDCFWRCLNFCGWVAIK